MKDDGGVRGASYMRALLRAVAARPCDETDAAIADWKMS
jgi:hypothetical protein